MVAITSREAVVCVLPLAQDLILLETSSKSQFAQWTEVARIPNAGSCEHPSRVAKENVIQGMEPMFDVSRWEDSSKWFRC